LFPRHVNGALAPFSRRGVVEIQVGKPRDLRVRSGELLALSEGLEEPHRILGRRSGNARFAEDLNADSLDLVEAVLALEEEWSIEIPEDEMESVKTVGQAVDLVASKLGI
jgi:acyl carrier protein